MPSFAFKCALGGGGVALNSAFYYMCIVFLFVHWGHAIA
jgi:hypothetical protein